MELNLHVMRDRDKFVWYNLSVIGLLAKGGVIIPKKGFYQILIILFCLFLFAGLFNLTEPAPVLAHQTDSLEITGKGITNSVTFTLNELEEMGQCQHVYSTINTWPTKRWYVARGVKLRDLLALAGMTEDAQLIRFISSDSYSVTLTVKELLEDKRYYFPNLKENSVDDGSVPGSPEGALEVEPIIALVCSEGSNNPDKMNDMNALQFICGQRAVTEQTNNLFLKYVAKIEVLTEVPQKWDNPMVNIPSGDVPPGTQIKLTNKYSDADKIYYTTDGSTPTINSPMFNWSAKRWWPLRPGGVDNINRPLEIDEDTVIKAITIGPGKLDSEVVTFSYKADPTKELIMSEGSPIGVTLDMDAVDLQVGNTFELMAIVEPFNAADKTVTWSSSDPSVATVDNHGLVTVVGPGMATITVETVSGNLSASCVVNAGEKISKNQDDPVLTEPDPPSEQDLEIILGQQQPVVEGQEDEENKEDSTAEDTEETTSQAPEEEETASEQQVPEEGDWRHLADKESMAADAGDSLSQPGEQPHVYEVSANVWPLVLPEKSYILEIYLGGLFLALFLSGSVRKYREFIREVRS